MSEPAKLWGVPLPSTTSVVQFIIIAAFLWAYVQTPGDETMKGALIAAFSAAWGYSLGSSKGASENRTALNKMTDKLTEPTP